MTRVYRIVADKLNKRGLHASMMRPDQLVFSPPSHMGGGWLTFYKERWHIGTWGPRVYRISEKKDIVPLCKDFINSRNSGIVIPELADRYNLVEISDLEMESMFDDQDKVRRS
jgi:hypothetical protein